LRSNFNIWLACQTRVKVKLKKMARKRIKTLAADWGISTEEVLASCKRLELASARSESSLLSMEEAERVKAEIDARAHRAAALRSEAVFETESGVMVEKRLAANVVRRRHAEPPPLKAEETFAFGTELPAEAPPDLFLEEVKGSEPELPPGIEVPAQPQVLEQEEAATPHAVSEAPEVVPPAPEQPPLSVAEFVEQGRTDSEPGQKGEQFEVAGAEEQRAQKPAQEQTTRQEALPGAVGRATEHDYERPDQRLAQPPPAQRALREEGRPPAAGGFNLRPAARPSGPSLDDMAQRGPRVLGKIDLHRAPTPPPAPAVGTGARAQTTGGPPAAAVSVDISLPGAAKPGARVLKKKRVVKKESSEILSEREVRGFRFPKKKRALPGKEQKKTTITTPKASKRTLRIAEGISVGDLAHSMGIKAAAVIKQLMDLGTMSTVNQWLDVDTAALVAGEFGYQVESSALDVDSLMGEEAEAPAEQLVPRPPVVTVMGHVDHGKTSLLDAIRHTNVAAGESGGITQHIGAYTVSVQGQTITFIDTPGHEAFTGMRARGAKVTDIVVLVVAADEGVMPQTEEAIDHARAAQVPIVVAINKIDRPDANVERVKRQLAERGLAPEEYGGDTITVALSARTGEGIEQLLEMILLQAEVLELKANPKRLARGVVIESKLDRGRGPVATVLVQDGTLRQGDAFVCGTSFGRVRAMVDHRGERVQEAGPSIPVEIFGLSSVPEPGATFNAVDEEAKARQIAELRQAKQREGDLQKTSRLSLEELSERLKAGEARELKVIVKGDTQGSVEALSQALRRLSTEEVRLDVIHASVGGVTETDVTLATASKAIVLGFNVRPEPKAAALAEAEGVDIRLYSVIYQALDDVRQAMEGLLAPSYREKPLGRAEVRQVFTVSGLRVAGSMVLDGKIGRSNQARLVRDGSVIWEGKIASLRRFKDDVREVQSGYECGIGLENFNDVKPGDIIEVFELEAVARRLSTPSREFANAEVGLEKQF
jgi:translation initiation factor IF-2